MDSVKVTRMRASSILIKTLKSIGYSEETAQLASWSALWLEDRQFPGVLLLVNYMLFANNMGEKERQPQKNEKVGLTGACPFTLTESLLHLEDKWKPRGGVAFGAPFFPFLMAPVFVDWYKSQGLTVEFYHRGQMCLASNEGLFFIESLSDAFFFPNFEREELASINLSTKPLGGEASVYLKVNNIKLPATRLRGAGALRLDDNP